MPEITVSELNLFKNERDVPMIKIDHDLSKDKCCDEMNLIIKGGYWVCTKCGYVHDKVILTNQLRRAYTKEEIKERRYSEPVHFPIGPRTKIIPLMDHNGILMDAKIQQKFVRLSKIHKALLNSRERNLQVAKNRLRMVKDRLSLSDFLAGEIFRIYNAALRYKITRGRSIDAVLSGCIYLACKIHHKPVQIDEISRVMNVNRKYLVKIFNILSNILYPRGYIPKKRFRPSEYVKIFAENLGISITMRKLANKICAILESRYVNFLGKDPRGIAAAVIYFVANILNERITQQAIAEVAGISEVTLRARVKNINKILSNH
ncbi:MAG: hypothetical protein ACTSRA_05345, partial [Promethearchaeota archaeon]